MITRTTAEWPATKQWLLDQIAAAQEQLESPTLDATATAIARGKVAAWRQIIRTVEPVEDEADASTNQSSLDASGY